MEIHMNPASVIEARLGIQPDGPTHAFFTAECARYMDQFVPWKTGTMAKTVIENGQPTENVHANYIEYNQKYAKYPYYGITHGKEMNYTKDMHPLATSYWDKHMWTAYQGEIIKSVQEFVDKGGK